MRIQKHLSQKGILSRREAEKYMQKGWVKVNGHIVTELGTQIDPEEDEVTIHPPAELKHKTLLSFYKPVGVVTHSPQNDEKEIKDLLPRQYKHLAPIGRLDKPSEGLILLTDDGVLARNLLQGHPPHTRTYEVETTNPLTSGQISKCERGMTLFGQKTKPIIITPIGEKRYKWEMTEGKNRQIRRMVQKVGEHVLQLKRVSFGKYKIGPLNPCEYRVEETDLRVAPHNETS